MARVAEHLFSVTLPRGRSVSCVIDVPERFVPRRTPTIVLGHGAGQDHRSPFLEFYASQLCDRGLAVMRFNFPYMERRLTGSKRPPDRMSALLDCYQTVVMAATERTGSPPGPLFLGGKSMGGRVATMLGATGRAKPDGYVLLGYPLHPSGKKDELRSEHLKGLAPMLFAQGDRDPLCDLELLRGERKRLRLAGALHVVPGGDHSFKQRKSTAERQRPLMERVAEAVEAFVERVLSR